MTSETNHRTDGLTAFRWLRRLLRVWGEKMGMVILLATAMTGLAWFDSNSTQPHQGQRPEYDDSPDSGVVVRSKVLHLWLPETLKELAKPQSPAQILRDHEDLKRFLECRHQEGLRYAVTTRGYQANGEYADITFIRQPYEDPRTFQEFVDILAGFGGMPQRDTAADFHDASVHMLSEERLSRLLSEMIAEMRRVK